MTKKTDIFSKKWKRPAVKPDPRAQAIRAARREFLKSQKEAQAKA